MAYSWELATISDYKPLEDPAKWLKCPNCNEHPRTWVFDNGNYARCRCAYMYERGGAAALSIIEAMHKRQMPYDEYKVLLRDAWNDHVRSLPLPQGAGGAVMNELSPAAQAILAAMEEVNLDIEEDNNLVAAAALRALADELVPDVRAFLSPGTAGDIRDHITAIATELENHAH